MVIYSSLIMKIVYLCISDPLDPSHWSGTTRNILINLSKCHELSWFGDNVVSGSYWHHIFTGKKGKFFPEEYTEKIGRVLSERIVKDKFDLVIVRDYYFAVGLDISIPIVYVTDTTFDLFKGYLNIKDEGYKLLAEKTERSLISTVDSIIYSSNWAKDNAINHYGGDISKLHVVEFGANIPSPDDYIIDIDTNVCNLVFIGRNWEKKGGQKALDAFRILQGMGVESTLTIIGSKPKEDIRDDNVKVYPYLDKSKSEDLKIILATLKKSHFLVLPTEFDAYGIVFCEASAYGVPSIASDVGGVSQPIREGKNGFLLSPESTAEDYANKILDCFKDKDKYLELRKSSRKEYEERLNWDVWLSKVNKILTDTISSYKKKDKIFTSVEKVIEDLYLPVYAINLKERIDRRKHLEKQFEGKSEFNVTYVDAIEDTIGAVGLWKSMVECVKLAKERKEDIIIICEDDHTFTENYTKEYLFNNIISCSDQGCELLSGGIGGFGVSIPVDRNRYWVDWFWCTQFIVIFESLFDKIIEYDFKDNDTADGVLSVISDNPMTLYPFISIQKDFGYSDVTRSNNEISGLITKHFQNSNFRLSKMYNASRKFYRF